ncbi:hypothetical protein [Microbulbifer pacificus]|uniref:Uncharacterized protein n=1 Tax=Microbulbifer pacificus TaxID=407164 RepID=A0AAU0MWS2_9GAMM|nr:hypothetical protein [Microbulbifer pacificus]WOX04635.1 hypothetical protein R5R33_12900 [Microbulbifer pacificus]
MKFIHLTPHSAIGNVKRNGIRRGDGRRGRGVYAVPLMMIQRVSHIQTNDCSRIILGDPRSSVTLWKWLANVRSDYPNLAAVTFETNHEHWPGDLYINIGPSIGIEWIKKLTSADIVIEEKNLESVKKAHEQGYWAELAISVLRQSAIGIVLWHLQQAGFRTWARFDDSIEIVFRKPVKASLIDRITPLYRTNKQFKRELER